MAKTITKNEDKGRAYIYHRVVGSPGDVYLKTADELLQYLGQGWTIDTATSIPFSTSISDQYHGCTSGYGDILYILVHDGLETSEVKPKPEKIKQLAICPHCGEEIDDEQIMCDECFELMDFESCDDEH